jgi:hypothetical protein
VRRVREPVAWILLVVTAIWVLVSAWQLFGLPGAPVPAPPHPVAVPVTLPQLPIPSPVAVTAYVAGTGHAPHHAGGIFALPVR